MARSLCAAVGLSLLLRGVRGSCMGPGCGSLAPLTPEPTPPPTTVLTRTVEVSDASCTVGVICPLSVQTTTTTTTTVLYELVSECGTCCKDGVCKTCSCSKTCSGAEEMYQECSGSTCGECNPVDCKLAEWGEWGLGDCNGLCRRHRIVNQTNNECGTVCEGPLEEAKECAPKCPHQDCEWGDWQDWSSCSCTCGGGTRTRDRIVAQSVVGIGHRCPASETTQLSACNTQPCNECVDGTWGEWEAWSPCTKTCGVGLTTRSRKVNQSASPCGSAPEGLSVETQACQQNEFCEADADCKFSQWSNWSACSCSCDGVKERRRHVESGATGRGTCNGTTIEMAPCNEATKGEGACCSGGGCDTPIDCEVSDWSPWSECSERCGSGQHERTRNVQVEAKYGGKSCNASLSEVKACLESNQTCGVDCVWGDWGEWGACSQCGGEKVRSRSIVTNAKGTGKQCEAGASREIAVCNPVGASCGAPLYCEWAPWTEWTNCSSTCGTGTRKRRRELQSTKTKPAGPDAGMQLQELLEANERLRQKQATEHTGKVQELAVSFGLGLLSCVALMGVVRVARGRQTRSEGYSQPAATELSRQTLVE